MKLAIAFFFGKPETCFSKSQNCEKKIFFSVIRHDPPQNQQSSDGRGRLQSDHAFQIER